MKTIFLIRHAKACKSTFSQIDFDRVLEKSGEADAEAIAQKLKDANYTIEQIVASAAKRTTQTALIFAIKNNIELSKIIFENKLYNAPAHVYEDIILSLDNGKNTVAIVGHNNGISDYASSLLKERMYLDMPPGGIVAFRAAIQNWEDFVNADKELLFFEAPENSVL